MDTYLSLRSLVLRRGFVIQYAVLVYNSLGWWEFQFSFLKLPRFSLRRNSFPNNVKSNQILIVITLFWLIWQQKEFHLVPNHSVKCNCSQNFISSYEVGKIIHLWIYLGISQRDTTLSSKTLSSNALSSKEHWLNGTLVEWNIGRMEHWSNGTLVEWNIGRTEHLSNLT